MQKCRQNKAEHFRLQQPEISHINALKIVMHHKDFVPQTTLPAALQYPKRQLHWQQYLLKP